MAENNIYIWMSVLKRNRMFHFHPPTKTTALYKMESEVARVQLEENTHCDLPLLPEWEYVDFHMLNEFLSYF